MGSVDNYKSGMGLGLRAFFEKYEPSIKKLIDDLDSDGFLLKKFSGEQVTRLQNLTKSSNMALKLSNDFESLFADGGKESEKIESIKKVFNTEDENRIAEHFGAILTNTYLTLLERLKLFLLFFVDWNKLGKKHRDIHGVGSALKVLKEKYKQNKYLDYFDSGTRNSFAHYTFFWESGGKIKLCSEIFDTTPKEISLIDLMKEIKELNVLTEGFYMLLSDKFNLPEIKLERMER